MLTLTYSALDMAGWCGCHPLLTTACRQPRYACPSRCRRRPAQRNIRWSTDIMHRRGILESEFHQPIARIDDRIDCVARRPMDHDAR